MKPGILCLAFLLILTCSSESAHNWAQWRGPNRTGKSEETGLRFTWGESGPREVWRKPVGVGFSGISVRGNRVFTMFADERVEYVLCLEAATGKEVWRTPTGGRFRESRGDGPRSMPTVDGRNLYVVSAEGTLFALSAATGGIAWSRNFVEEFGSELPTWGYACSPLVVRDRLYAEVGGDDNRSVACFDTDTGETIWSNHTDGLSYSSPIAVTTHGQPQIVFITEEHVIGTSPEDGRIIWSFAWPKGINIATPLFVPDDRIFVSAAYDKGAVMIRLREDGANVAAEEAWASRGMENHFNSSILHEGHLYGFDNSILKCIDVDSGEERWKTRAYAKGSLIFADGHLIVLGEEGFLATVVATPESYQEVARDQVLEGRCWTPPTLANGRVYVRNFDEIVCIDLAG